MARSISFARFRALRLTYTNGIFGVANTVNTMRTMPSVVKPICR